MSSVIKLSSAETREFWEIPVLFEDPHLLALDKPAGLLASPDRYDPKRPSLTMLLHAGIAAGKPWARERGLSYLMQAHRLDPDTSGAILMAKAKPVLVALANYFNSGKPGRTYIVLVQGVPAQDRFEINARLAPHPAKAGVTRVESRLGKQSQTIVEIVERFDSHALIKCEPTTERAHQIRAHLRHVGLPVVGDTLYGGKPLWLSRLKRNYRLKEGREERPLMARAAVHAGQLTLPHPVTGEALSITAPWPKDLLVALKYLRLFAKPGP